MVLKPNPIHTNGALRGEGVTLQALLNSTGLPTKYQACDVK